MIPHLNWILQELEYGILGHNEEALIILYNFLYKIPEFRRFVNQLSNETIESGIKFAKTVINDTVTVEICREQKEVASQLAELAIKVAIREIAVKKLCTKAGVRVASFLGLGSVVSTHVQIIMLMIDGVQFELKYFGYTKAGINVGLFGNIAIGALTCYMKGKFVGGSKGAAVGFGTWLIGEAIGKAVGQTFA